MLKLLSTKCWIVLILSIFLCCYFTAMAGENSKRISQYESSDLKILTEKQLKLRQIAGKQKDGYLQKNQKKFQEPPQKRDILKNPFSFQKSGVDFPRFWNQGSKASNLLINGSSSATIDIGDSVVITFDFSTGAETAQLMIYLDTNHNGILDPGEMEVGDGRQLLIDNSWDDQDTTWGSYSQKVFSDDDGANRAHADFIFEVNDGYAVGTATLSVQQVTTSYYIYGSVIPNRENIVVAAFSDTAVYYALTAFNGDYIIYVPDDVPRDWMIFSVDFLQIYHNILPPEPQIINISGPTNFDFIYQNATAWLQGSVLDENQNPVQGIHVSAGGEEPYQILIDTTNTMGSYLGGAFPDTFWVYLNEQDLWPDYLVPWDQEAVLTFGDTTPVDFNVYQTDSYITGYVYLDGNPIWGAKIDAWNWSEGCYIQTYSGLDGSYQLPVASELDFYGGYNLDLDDIPDDIINNDYYWNINSGSSNINFDLERILVVEGYITDYLTGLPIQDAWIRFYNDSLYFETYSDHEGYYLIGLLPGNFIMEISHWDYVDIQRFDLEIEDYFLVENYKLVGYGNCTYSGNVSSETGPPLMGARVEAFDYYSHSRISNMFTDAFGDFSFDNFPTGYYLFRCRAPRIGPGYILEFFDNTIFLDSATIVYGISGAVIDTIDFELAVGGGISGEITDQDGITLLPGSVARAFDYESGDFRSYIKSDDGSYTLTGLPQRNMRVQGSCPGFFTEYYDNVYDPSMATPVPVIIPNITPDINFTLNPDGSMYKQAVANLTTSLRNIGTIGIDGSPIWPACEWPTGSQDNYLYEGGIWIGADVPGYGTGVSTSDYDEEFNPLSDFLVSSLISDQDVEIWYQDDVGWNWLPLGVTVHQSSYAWSGEDYIIFKYVIYYDGRYGQINDFYIGYLMDYDICTAGPDTFALDDKAAYDGANYISYMYDDDGDGGLSPGYAGIRILSHTPSMHAYWDWISNPQDDYNRYNLLNSGTFMGPSPSQFDYRVLQAAGPIPLNGNDSTTVYLAFAVGDSLPGLQNSIQAALQKYQTITSISAEENVGIPTTYALKQNYPNPFNPSTTFEFSLPKTEFVTLNIYNLLGQEVVTLVSKKLIAGNYKYSWDASNFASGIYYYRIEAGSFVETKKLLLIK